MKDDTAKLREKGSKAEDTKVAAGVPTIKLRKTKGKVDSINIIASFMSKEHGIADDRLYLLHQAVTPAKIQGIEGVAVRVFEAAAAREKEVKVDDFDSLNEHPELILYDGYYQGFKKNVPQDIHIEKRTGTGLSLLDQKLQDGTITELGMEKEPSRAMKLLGGFGHFMAMGGFMLVLLVVVGLAVAISILAQRC